MLADQSVHEIVEDALECQANVLSKKSGCSLREALGELLESVLRTDAGRQLNDLRDSPHAHEKVRGWQEIRLRG